MVPFTRQPVANVLAAPPSPAVRFLRSRLAARNARMIGVPFFVGYPLTPMLFGLPDMRGVSALPVRRYYNYLHAISPKAGDFTIQHVPVLTSPLLDLAAVRYVVLSVPPPLAPATSVEAVLLTPPSQPAANDPNMPAVYQDDRVVVYENRAALPRVRIVHQANLVPDEAAALRWAQAVGERPDHARELGLAETVILEPDQDGNVASALSRHGSSTEYARLVNTSDPDRLVIEAHLEEPGFVVIADTYYPGWKAWVDGTRTSIFPADLLFRAVFVAAGTHSIALSYEPTSFLVGQVLFVIAAAFCLFALVRARSPSRRSGNPRSLTW